ncbi:hypothetical protein DXG01_007764 [Tephrocybe rancida]|nr:hypothetical protein DXG01_007764 [Tephrocybe rancida]
MSSAPSSPLQPIVPLPSTEPPCAPSPLPPPPTALGKRETRSSGREKSSDEKPNYKEGKAPPKKRKRKPKAQQVKPEDTPWKVPRDPHTGGPIVLVVEDSDPDNSDIELDLEEQPLYYTGSRMVSYPVYGTRHDLEWTPAFHRNEDLEWFYELDKATVEGRKYMSYVKVIYHKNFILMDARTLLDFFKTYACIMVVDGPRKNEQFTLEALSRVGALDEPVTLHDFTFPTSDRHRSGTLLDLYHCATGQPDKSVSCLDLPSTMDLFAELPFASDIAAWAEVQGRAYHPVDLTHVPDLTTWDGCLGLIFLCVYFELHSAIYEWRYDDPEEDQRRFEASIKSRTRARQLMYWFFSTHALDGPAGGPGADASGILTGKNALHHIYVTLLARHARLLVRYKKYAWENGVFGERHDLTPGDVEVFINACIREGPAEVLYASMDNDLELSSFSWHGPTYVVRPVTPVVFDFPFQSGHVFGDRVTARHRGIILRLEPVGVLPCDDPKYDVTLYRPLEPNGSATATSDVGEAPEHTQNSGSEDDEDSEYEEPGSAPTVVRQPPRKRARRG